MIFHILAFLSFSFCAFAQFENPAWVGSMTYGASASAPAIQSIATDATTTPNATKLTLSGTQNAIRIFTGETPATEPGFNLYVSKNSGAVYNVRLYNWQGRIITGTAGDTFAFGTSNGRTLQFAPMTAPGSLTPPSGSSGTANCDKAGPPIWTPLADHITLPSAASTFQIATDSVERIVFVSEYDGTIWSNPRFVWTQTNSAVNVQCTYQHVALANYIGTSLSVTAPTGSIIGGTSATMTFGLPAVTGTTRTCSSVADFQTAITNAVSGDRIVLNAGTYPLTTNFIAASWSNNVAHGYHGAEGIEIVGATGNNADVVLCSAGNSNGNFSFYQAGASAYTYIKDITFAVTNAGTGQIDFGAGKFRLENLQLTGPQAASTSFGLFEFAISSGLGNLNADCLFCTVSNAYGDCFSAAGSASYNAASLIRLIACNAYHPGKAVNNQTVTSHFGIPIYVYGGTFSDATQNIFASMNDLSPLYCNFVTTSYGTRCANMVNVCLYGSYCSVTNYSTPTIQLVTNGYALFSRFYAATNPYNFFRSSVNGSATISHNVLRTQNKATSTTRAFNFSQAYVTVVGNIVDTFATGVRTADYSSGIKGNYTFEHNDFVNCTIAMDYQEAYANGIYSYFTNNISGTNTTSINTTAATRTNLLSDYNVLCSTVGGNYIAGPHDTTSVQPQLTATYIPVGGGNCDNTGLTNVLGWVGDSDPYGSVLFYLPTRASRGAREIPAIYTNAVMFPDLW